jgi:Rha family phage regulatory protein
MMNELVKISENKEVVTDSLKVAEYFEKRHPDLLRRIRNLLLHPKITERNFTLSEYLDSTGRKLPLYIIDRDGFSYLALGLTGKKALDYKIEFTQAFKKVLLTIQDQQKLLLNQQKLLTEKAQTENKLFKLDYVLEEFGEPSAANGLPRTKPIAYLRGEREQKVRIFSDELGLYSKPYHVKFEREN